MKKSRTKFFWLGTWFLSLSVSRELYYTTSKRGSRAYYFFRLGYQAIQTSEGQAIAPILTVLFLEISIGKLYPLENNYD